MIALTLYVNVPFPTSNVTFIPSALINLPLNCPIPCGILSVLSLTCTTSPSLTDRDCVPHSPSFTLNCVLTPVEPCLTLACTSRLIPDIVRGALSAQFGRAPKSSYQPANRAKRTALMDDLSKLARG